MKIRAWALAVVAAGALLSRIETNAQACSPPPAGLSGSIPANDATYPANAAVFLMGFGVSLDDVTVTVDGAPAALKPAGDIVPVGLGNTSVLVDPTPAAGQTVVISGTFCPQAAMCEPKSITFVTNAPDMAAPEPPTGLTFDVHDYVDFKSGGGDCQSDSDLAYWVTTLAKPESEGGAPLLLTVEGFRDAGLTDLVTTTTTFMSAAPVTLGIRMLAGALNGESAPEALCFRATIQDAAGNAAAPSTSACKPCSYRKDEEGSEPNFLPPSEPMWTVKDIYPGGPCDAGLGVGGGGAGGNGGGGSGDSGGGETDTDGGCGCRMEGGATRGAADGAAGFMSMSLLGLGLVRRRRARAHR